MPNKTQITNLALQRLGVTKSIASIDENSVEARAAKLVIDDERDAVLEDFPWPFATAYATLGLVSDPDTAANYDWYYAYRKPSDCVFARRIVTALGRKDTVPPAYKLGQDATGDLIYTDQEDAQIEYTARVDVSRFSALAASMVAWRLAINLAPALSRIDGITRTVQVGYEREKQRAQVKALNEGQSDEPRDAEWIEAR
jgi:hypothetical protein